MQDESEKMSQTLVPKRSTMGAETTTVDTTNHLILNLCNL